MENQSQIQMQADLDLIKGRYANNLRVTFTQEEFFLDFSTISPFGEALEGRIVVSPGHMKRISNYLASVLEQYEKSSGQPLTPAAEPKPTVGFKMGDDKAAKT